MRYAWIALAVLLGCRLGTADDEDEAPPPVHRVAPDGSIHLSAAEQKTLGLSVADAKRGVVPNVSVFYGVVQAESGTSVQVTSPVDGRIAAPPSVSLGAQVPAGAVLLEVAPVLAAAERVSLGVQGAEAHGEVVAAERELAVEKAALVRAQELARSRIVSEEKLQQAEASVASTQARLNALRIAQGLQSAGGGKPIPLSAPIPGRVVRLAREVGAPVKSGEPLAEVLGPGPRTVEVALPPDFPDGSAYEVRAGAGWVSAQLVFGGATVREDGTKHALLEVRQGAGLLPGETTAVRVALGSSEGLVLPSTAVVPTPQGDLVYVRTAEDTFRPHPVTVGARFAGEVRISSGLEEGTPVVTVGGMALRGEALRAQLQQGD